MFSRRISAGHAMLLDTTITRVMVKPFEGPSVRNFAAVSLISPDAT
jgi:hypothetical protein